MYAHAMYSRETVVVAEMQYSDLQDERSMRSLDVVFGPEFERYVVFPFFQLSVQFTNRVK
jgi:hypothetical protein